MTLKNKVKKNIKLTRYLLEMIAVKAGLMIFCAMKPQKASDFASKIARFVGKKISVHNLANKNLSKALPKYTSSQREEILDNMWDNLGRIVGEFGHIAKCKTEEIDNLIEIDDETEANIEELKTSKKGGIIFGAHIGNWEVGPKVFIKRGLRVSTVYRPLNNPFVEKLTANLRGVDMIEKSVAGSRKIIEVIKNGGFVIILADQKISEGASVKFFHDDAITTTSIARMALKYDIPLIPARSIRIGKRFKFMVRVEKPLAIEKSGNVNSDIMQITRNINQKLEEWIEQYPSQWFWVHNRWKR
jgi:Kdo2-lipid IVA lauroyltransferase/acyltransferase